MRPIVYGEGHPYAVPASGLGDESGIAALSTADMQAWRQQWLRPDNATLSIVGDTTLAEIMPLLEKQFADWKAPASPLPKASIPQAQLPARTHVVLIDQPGAIQANIFVSQLVPSSKDPNATVFEIANSVLGGEFSSRLNMNLREDKHWSYGSYSGARDAVGQRLWSASAAVQIDKTEESVQEMLREVVQFANGTSPASNAEVTKIQATEIRALPGAYETSEAVLGTMNGLARYGRPDDYPAKRAAVISGLTVEQVNKAAAIIEPEKLTVVVVGDLSKIKDKIAALNIGPITVLDSDGKPVK
jgi:predicted Zn-dependent peptidase